MKAITVQAPWSWLLTLPDDQGGKDIENRSWPITAPAVLLLHTGLRVDTAALRDERVAAALERWRGDSPAFADWVPWDGHLGRITAVMDITDCHPAQDRTFCCQPWGAPPAVVLPKRLYHWRRANVRLLHRPVTCRGAQGLWTVPADIAERIEVQL